MLSEDLNLKTKIKIGGIEFDFELFSIEKGNITEVKLNNELFSKNDGQDPTVSNEKPGVLVEKPEQNTQYIEQIPEKSVQPLVKPEVKPPVKKDIKTGKTRKGKSWNKKENKILIDTNKDLTVNQIVEKKLLPGRTKLAIQNQRHRLELHKYIVTKKQVKKVSRKINNKILARYKISVYEQCFNHLTFKLENKELFTTKDIFKILKKWYKNVLDRDLSKITKSTKNDYGHSYIRYGIDNSIFEKISHGKFKIKKYREEKKLDEPSSNKKFLEKDEKPNITVVTGGNQPVKGFEQHKQNRIQEIRDREKSFKKSNGVTV